MKRTLTVPMGSQHIALLEPLHFRFTCENEKIVGVEADVGYVHRGIEQACASKFKFKQVSYVVGRVCGLCSISHTTAYSQVAERLLGLEISKKAKYLRILVIELDRLHSHLLCLAHTAENTGFEALFMQIMRDREASMELLELVTGNRVQFDFSCVGGVNRDVTPEIVKELKRKLAKLKDDIEELYEVFKTNWSLSLRYKGVGALTAAQVKALNAVGPIARAAGVAIDVRSDTEDLLPWKEVGYKMMVEQTGDVFARNVIRFREMLNSFDIIENVLNGMPEGELVTDNKKNPTGEAVSRLEAPRGELFYYAKGNNTPTLERVKIKAPTFSNIAAFIEIFKGQEYASVPPILASLDPCLSCTAR
jgi:ech hydrogenase subunit E